MRRQRIWGLLAVLLAFPTVSRAQMPNPDFEQWTSSQLNFPTVWKTYGVIRKVAGYRGGFAARIMRDPRGGSGPGAVIYGEPENNFAGGIPLSGRPDSAVGYFKVHVPAGDTGWYLVFLKRGGQIISQDIFYLFGTDTGSFRRLAFAINYKDTGRADSVVIGVASTNPNNPRDGGFVVADSLHLTAGATAYQIPNGRFESWNTVNITDLNGWFTSNVAFPAGGTVPVTRSTDRVFGNYACRIENVAQPGGGYAMGYIMAGRQGDDGPEPGFPVSGRDSFLFINYKCTPQGDTINIAIIMYDSGQRVGMGILSQHNTVSSWKSDSIRISYNSGYTETPDSAVVFAAAFRGGSNPHGNTVLWVDGFRLNSPMNRLYRPWLLPATLVPNPAQDECLLTVFAKMQPGSTPLVTNAAGQTVKPEIQRISDTQLRISTRGLPAGIYHLSIPTVQGMAGARLMVK